METNADGEIRTEATVKIRIGDEVRHEVAEGDGPVNALDAAMRKALNGSFPDLRELHLVDYKVRVINSEAATAAGVRVVIESQDEDDVWGTVGVSENVIEASWIALVDSFEYKLYKDEEAAKSPSPSGTDRGRAGPRVRRQRNRSDLYMFSIYTCLAWETVVTMLSVASGMGQRRQTTWPPWRSWECEQVSFNVPLLVLDDPRHSVAEKRWAGLGRTNGGRLRRGRSCTIERT